MIGLDRKGETGSYRARENMRTSVEKAGDNKVLLRIEIDRGVFDRATTRAFRKLAKDMTLPGFRKGKVPRALFEARYGKDVIHQQAVKDIIPDLYSQAVKAEGLKPIETADFDPPEIGADRVAFTFHVDVEPEVKLGQYKGLEVEKPIRQITDDDVEKELKVLRERHAELVGVDRKTVQKGDFIIIDFQGYKDGEPFPGGAAEGYQLEVGAHTLLPAFEDQLIGIKAGEETEIRVDLPQDDEKVETEKQQGDSDDPQTENATGDDKTAGDDAGDVQEQPASGGGELLFRVIVHEIKVKEYPELDDEFARDIGEYETIDELRQAIREQQEFMAAQNSERVVRDTVVKMAADNASVGIPEVLIQRQIERQEQGMEFRLQAQGLDMDGYLKASGMSKEDLEERMRPDAEMQVKIRLTLDAIARAEGIEASDEEIDKRVDQSVKHSRDPESRKQYDSEPVRQLIAEDLTREKVVDFLVENAELRQIDWEEYLKRQQDLNKNNEAAGSEEEKQEKDVSSGGETGRIVVASSMADVERAAKTANLLKEG